MESCPPQAGSAQQESEHAVEVRRLTARAELAEARVAELESLLTASPATDVRVKDLIADAQRQADRIRETARTEAEALLAGMSDQLVEMGTAYREAITEARRVVHDIADALRGSHTDGSAAAVDEA